MKIKLIICISVCLYTIRPVNGQVQDSVNLYLADLKTELYSYNIVPNSDFHNFRQCPDKYTIIPKSYFVDDWTMPTGGTPDYFNVCSNQAGVPSNWVGHLNPKSGYGYVGLIAGRYTNNFGKVVEVREYIQAELKKLMEAGQVYLVRFYVSLAGYSRYALDGMGASFSDTLVNVTNFIEHLPLQEHVGNPPNQFMDQKGKWMKIEGLYTATGSEKYITIGNFRSDNETNEKDLFTRSDLNCSYYLIDDILVAPVNKKFLALYETTQNKTGKKSSDQAKNMADPPIFQPVLFDFNQTIVNDSFKNTIIDLASFMQSHPDIKVSLIGHTDSTGDTHYNMTLSKKRAKEVARLLTKKDISTKRLQIKGKGELEPLNNNVSEEQRFMNRRVEIHVH
jgi:OmpA-OmpF porin, OOP family